jgi:hypothetical protein
MKIEKKHINYIQVSFSEMNSLNDFLDLLNYTKPIIYGANTIPFKLKQVTYYSNPKLTKKVYKEFHLKKKSGNLRTINAPENGLKAIQKTLALILQCVFKPNEAAKGFITGKSIVDNAKEHIGKNYVYNIDLKDFFPSIDQARIWACLKLEPFNLNHYKANLERLDVKSGYKSFLTKNNEIIYFKFSKKTIKYDVVESKEKTSDSSLNLLQSKLFSFFLMAKESNSDFRPKLKNVIAAISSIQMNVERKNEKGQWIKVNRNVLPQGAPTSPVFSNIICQKLDRRLSGVAKKFHLNYTRYADDITFSSMHNVYQESSEFLKELTRIIKDQNFDIKESKTRLQKTGYRQEVTGIVVNDKVNVRKRYVKQIRMWLYYWEKYGYNKAEAIFLRDYFIDKGHVKNAKPNFQNVLSGKLEYLKMVKGSDNATYLSLNKRFEKLNGYRNPLDLVLLEWENNGIESAMEIYKRDKYEQ